MSKPLLGAAAIFIVLLLARPSAADDPPAPVIEAPAASVDTGAHCRSEAISPLAAPTPTTLVQFKTSPFPYDGEIPADGGRFLDYTKDGKRGHTSPRGFLHLEEEAYSDRRSLLYMPAGFDLSRPEHALLMVFFHGNFARLHQDVDLRQRVPLQLAKSGLNAALIAPQFAVDIADSSAGSFWQPGIFEQYLAEAAEHLAALRGDPCTRAIFDRLDVVLVAYSGGYDPAAYALAVGGADRRIRGVILLDALYGETDKFDKWIGEAVGGEGSGFFFSAYSDSSRAENMALRHSLTEQGIKTEMSSHPLQLKKGIVDFLFAGSGIDHRGFVTKAWVTDPLKAVLSAIEGFRAASKSVEAAHPINPRVGPPERPIALSPSIAARAPHIRAMTSTLPAPPPPAEAPTVGTVLPALHEEKQ